MSIPQVGSLTLDTQVIARPRDGQAKPVAAEIAAGSGMPATSPPVVDPGPAPAPQASGAKPSPEQVKEAVQQMNRAMRVASSALEFSVDQDTDRVIVKMTDRDTGEVVMEIPSQQTLALARYLEGVQKGMLLSQKA